MSLAKLWATELPSRLHATMQWRNNAYYKKEYCAGQDQDPRDKWHAFRDG